MNRAAMTKFELLPEDIPSANVANRTVNKTPLSTVVKNSNTLKNSHAALSTPKVPVHAVSLSSLSDSSSKLTEDEVLYLMRRANISLTDYEFLVPSEDESAK